MKIKKPEAVYKNASGLLLTINLYLC